MNTLLVMTVGQTDVQLVRGDKRQKFDGSTCGTLLEQLLDRSWSVVDAPTERSSDLVKQMPEGEIKLCTPKLDAVINRIGELQSTPITSVLILETTRQDPRDPRLAGQVLARRLHDRGVNNVVRVAFLTDAEQLEDPSIEVDAVVRRTVVAKLSDAIKEQVNPLTKNDRVFVATTGGLAAANEVINELVRLHAVGGPDVTVLEVPDVARTGEADQAVEEKFHPAASIRARWHALDLIQKGNLLAAYGAVSHLENQPGQTWIKVVRWLADFAASLPIPDECSLDLLKHPRMAVRAALRVEFALRAGDIPRAVHGTVAFYESALWDHLLERMERSPDPQKSRMFRFKDGQQPAPEDREKLFRKGDGSEEDRKRPFELKESQGGVNWYLIDDDKACAGRLAKYFLKEKHLHELGTAVSGIRNLRNDVAHNEPTPELMRNARHRMTEAGLWSQNDRFLSQPIIQEVLKELGITEPESLCDRLIATVRTRLRDHRLDGAPSS